MFRPGKRGANGLTSATQLQLPDNLNSSDTRMRNNLVQHQFDLYAVNVDRQVKSLAKNKYPKYTRLLRERVKELKNLKKFQYDTEYALHEARLKEFVASSKQTAVERAMIEEANKHLARIAAIAAMKQISESRRSSIIDRRGSIQRRSRTTLFDSMSNMTNNLSQTAAFLKSGSKSSIGLSSTQLHTDQSRLEIKMPAGILNPLAQKVNSDKVFNRCKSEIKHELMLRFRLQNDDAIKKELASMRKNNAGTQENTEFNKLMLINQESREGEEKEDDDDDEEDNADGLDYEVGGKRRVSIYQGWRRPTMSHREAVKEKERIVDEAVQLIDKKIDARKNHLSIVLSGNSKKYFIYRFQPNGYFTPNVKQPATKTITHTKDDLQGAFQYFKEMYSREQTKFKESQKKIHKFCDSMDMDQGIQKSSRKQKL